MKKTKKTKLIVDCSAIKHRNAWSGVKPYTRIEVPKTVYNRKQSRVRDFA